MPCRLGCSYFAFTLVEPFISVSEKYFLRPLLSVHLLDKSPFKPGVLCCGAVPGSIPHPSGLQPALVRSADHRGWAPPAKSSQRGPVWLAPGCDGFEPAGHHQERCQSSGWTLQAATAAQNWVTPYIDKPLEEFDNSWVKDEAAVDCSLFYGLQGWRSWHPCCIQCPLKKRLFVIIFIKCHLIESVNSVENENPQS